MIGVLTNTDLNNDYELGLLAFYRLIGCVFFAAHRSCLHTYTSPVELFRSLKGDTAYDVHSKFLDIIRKASWKGTYEDELLPSDGALQLHWLRSCQVSTFWGQALQAVFMYPEISQYGWKLSQDPFSIEVEWDTEENVQKIRRNVSISLRQQGL